MIKQYLDQKFEKINNYFDKWNLDTAVIGVSGGIDSGVVLCMLNDFSFRRNSKINNISAHFIVIRDNDGISNNDLALERAKIVGDHLGLPINIEARKNICIDGRNWVRGQVASNLKAITLREKVSTIELNQYHPILVGTTNRVEQYFGLVGKSADGNVDIQPIYDLLKSEVAALAIHYGIPNEIIYQVPTGDCYDPELVDEVFLNGTYAEAEWHIAHIEPFVSDIPRIEVFRRMHQTWKKNSHKQPFLSGYPDMDVKHDYFGNREYLECIKTR